MSLSKQNNFANDDSDILEVQETVDLLYKNSYTITQMGTTTVPAIAIGSRVEVNGSYYLAESEEAISTTDPVTSSGVADGLVYLCMVPAGDGLTATAAFTATAPTWSDTKQGWYGTGGQANNKYLHYACTKATSTYSDKYIFPHNNNLNHRDYLENTDAKVFTATDATERTTTSTSYVDETNLDLSVTVKDNDLVLVRFDGNIGGDTNTGPPDFLEFNTAVKIVLESGTATEIQASNEPIARLTPDTDATGGISNPSIPFSCQCIFKAGAAGTIVFRNQFKRIDAIDSARIKERFASAIIL